MYASDWQAASRPAPRWRPNASWIVISPSSMMRSDPDGARRSRLRHSAVDAPTAQRELQSMTEVEGIRRALFGAITFAALSGCGRTEGLLPGWSDEAVGGTIGTGSIAGRGGATFGVQAGAAGVAQRASAGA